MPPRAPWSWDQLWVAWQPIVVVETGAVYGHEALARGPHGSAWELPAALFDEAARTHSSRYMEVRCRRMAIERGARLIPKNQVMFMNVNGRWPAIPLYPAELPIPPERVAIEVSETQPILSNYDLLMMVARWRNEGHPIVIDDYGTGYATAASILALQPNIVKLDRRLIADIDQDPQRQSVVRAIRDLTGDLDIRLVAEGVETVGELQVVREFGIDFAQGFLIAIPSPDVVRGPLALPTVGEVTRRTLLAPREPDAVAADPLAFYARAVAAADLPTYVVDRLRRIIGWNDRATEVTGYASDEMIGRRCFDPGGLEHRDEQGRPLCVGACPLVVSMVTQAPHSAIVSLRTKSGVRKDVQVLSLPIWDSAHGRVLGAVEQFQLLPVQAIASAPDSLVSETVQPRPARPRQDHPRSPVHSKFVAGG